MFRTSSRPGRTILSLRCGAKQAEWRRAKRYWFATAAVWLGVPAEILKLEDRPGPPLGVIWELTGRVAPSFRSDEVDSKMCFSRQSRRVTDKAHHGLLVNRNDHAWAAGLSVSRAPPASAATGVASKPFFLIVAAVSGIRFLCAANAAPWWATNDLTTGNVQGKIGTLSCVTAPNNAATASNNLTAASSRWSLAELDKVLGIKGWNYAPPSFTESATQDQGGSRSRPALVG